MRKVLTVIVAWFAVSVSFNSSSFGASTIDHQRLKSLFETKFYSDLYQPRKCGQNIMGFVSLAHKEGIPLQDAWIVQWTNPGFDFFGMVQGVVARDGARDRNGSYIPGPRNWYHHVILDFDGWIFDFDFTNSPRVERAQTYVTTMFGPKSTQEKPNPELPNYNAEIVMALDYVRQLADPNASIAQPLKISLKDYLLNSWR